MSNSFARQTRVLGIDPCTKGFGFAVIEGGTRLLDWGVARVYSRNSEEFLVRINAMIERYRPTLIALEQAPERRGGSRKGDRIASLMRYSDERGLPCIMSTRRKIRQAIALRPDATKHEVAARIAQLFPDLMPLLPMRRRPWDTEDARMNVFDAVGFALHSTTRKEGAI